MYKELSEGIKKCKEKRDNMMGEYCIRCPLESKCVVNTERIGFKQFDDGQHGEIRVVDEGSHSDIEIMDGKYIVARLHILKDRIDVFPMAENSAYIPTRRK